MKKVILSAALLVSFGVFASNNQIPVGTEVEILQEINFPERSTGVWLQKGNVVESDLDPNKSHCMISSLSIADFDYETGFNAPIAKGEVYQVNYLGNLINTKSGRALLLDCDKSENLYNIIAQKISNGRLPYLGNTSNIKLKTIKKITSGLLLIKN